MFLVISRFPHDKKMKSCQKIIELFFFDFWMVIFSPFLNSIEYYLYKSFLFDRDTSSKSHSSSIKFSIISRTSFLIVPYCSSAFNMWKWKCHFLSMKVKRHFKERLIIRHRQARLNWQNGMTCRLGRALQISPCFSE